MSDEEALAYAEEHGIPMPHVDGDATAAPAGDEFAIAEQLQAGGVAGEDEDATPAKTPKKAPTRKRKSEVADTEAAKTASAVATPDTKKRRRTSKAADAETKEEASTKKGSRSKKAKN